MHYQQNTLTHTSNNKQKSICNIQKQVAYTTYKKNIIFVTITLAFKYFNTFTYVAISHTYTHTQTCIKCLCLYNTFTEFLNILYYNNNYRANSVSQKKNFVHATCILAYIYKSINANFLLFFGSYFICKQF